MEATIKLKLKPFSVPNFVLVEATPKQRQEGFKDASSYPLSDLDERTLMILCDEFTESVFKKAGKDMPTRRA